MMALDGSAHVAEGHLAVARGRVEEPHRLEHPLDLHAGGVDGDQHHRVLAVAVGMSGR